MRLKLYILSFFLTLALQVTALPNYRCIKMYSPNYVSLEQKKQQDLLFNRNSFAGSPDVMSLIRQGLGASLNWNINRNSNWGISMIGQSHFTPGLSEVYIKIQNKVTEDKAFFLMLSYIRRLGLELLQSPYQKAGTTIKLDIGDEQSKNYQIIFLDQIKKKDIQGVLYEAQKSIAQDSRDFVINGYRREITTDEKILHRLKEISKDVEARTILFAKTQEGYFKLKDNSQILFMQERENVPKNLVTQLEADGLLLPQHFTFDGVINVVYSSRKEEKLPLEILTGYNVERPKHGLVIEIGRFFVEEDKRNDKDTSMRLFGLAASFIESLGGRVSKIVIEASRSRSRLFSKLGFKAIHEKTNFNNEPEYIMEVDPAVLGRILTEQAMLSYFEKSDSNELAENNFKPLYTTPKTVEFMPIQRTQYPILKSILLRDTVE